MITVIFVCLGNICRSPMAEAVFQKLVGEAGLSAQIRVDSAGTGSWHVGEKAHPGTRKVLQDHDIAYNGRARQIDHADMQADQTYIVALDNSNLNELHRRFGPHHKRFRLLEFARHTPERNVPDPYYTGNFETVYQLVLDGCQGLLDYIKKQEDLT